MRRAWLAALCTVVGIGCTDGDPASQVLTGRIGTAGAVAIRAVADDTVVTAAPIRSDGSFTLSLPAGQRYRLEVLTSDGVKQILSHQDGWTGLAFKVCVPTAPFDVGAIGDSSMCDPNVPGCVPGGDDPVPCMDPTDPNCMPPPEPCTVAADGTTTCPAPCSDPMDPSCQPPPPCGGPNQPACPPPPCSDPTDPNCMPPEPCIVEPDGTITCPPQPCSDPMDPSCQPPPPCDPTDPNCMPPPPSCGGPNEPACPPPPCDPTDPNCQPPDCMVAADGTTTCPPPPCGDPMDPNTCQDPCVTDPLQCGCPPTEPNCWPPPQPMPCDPSGMCEPGGTLTPQHVPGDFGCLEPFGA